MKLKRFTASRVHGYKNFNVTFNDSITFLVGPNGSGKSTALKLIEAMLTPSVRDLSMIDFTTAKLELEVSNSTRSIIIEKNRETITIILSWEEESLRFPELSESRREFFKREPRASDEFFAKLGLDLSSHVVFREITNIPPPLFLGVDRQYQAGEVGDGILHDDPIVISAIKKQAAARRLFTGDSRARLQDTQVLVREAYRSARTRSDREEDRLRNRLLLSIFDYSELSMGETDPFYLKGKDELEKLKNNANHIASVLGKLGVDQDELRTKRDEFSSKLQDLFLKLEKESEQPTTEQEGESEYSIIEYLLNRAHLVRLAQMMKVVEEYNDRSRRAFRRIHQFEAALSWFFADSNKKVQVDEVGRIAVERQDGRMATVNELSSGERQIVMLFAHVFFNTFGTRSKVFVIDEPELSLHIRWQEHLVEKIQSYSAETQLIFATHSPDIVSDRKKLCVEV